MPFRSRNTFSTHPWTFSKVDGQEDVYRLFDFRDDPKLFLVPGDISMSFALEATQFVARLT